MSSQIATLYEAQGLSPAAISQALGLSPEIVELDLSRNSKKYRNDLASAADQNISDKELKGLYARVKALAVQEDDPRLALQACQFLINDRKGRLDKVQTTIVNNNIFQKISTGITAAKERTYLELNEPNTGRA